MALSTVILMGVGFVCIAAIIIAIIVVEGRRKREDKTHKMHPIVSGILLVTLLILLTFLGEAIGSLEKGFTKEHFWYFIAIFFIWVVALSVKNAKNKIKPYHKRKARAFQYAQEDWNATTPIEASNDSTTLTLEAHNKTILFTEDEEGNIVSKTVDAFLFNVFVHSETEALIVIDSCTLDNEFSFISPTDDLITQFLKSNTVSAHNVHSSKDNDEDEIVKTR